MSILGRARRGVAVGAMLILVACQAASPTPSAPASAAASAVPGGEISSLADVQTAVVRIVAEGSFVDPQQGTTQSAGSGSGFIIDPSGIAVTNNHVVTGAALLDVYVGGADEPRNASILGVSECSDLAVIDIDGDGFPFLGWYDGDITPGLEVHAAGFPLADPEYTLTTGSVTKAAANGETQWASVDSVIEHDASIQPGNSGGPLVDAEGRVVGINYAVAEGVTDFQFRAISLAEALPVIEELREDRDVDSVGVNAEAIQTEDGLTGLWVWSVASGSAADQAGIEGGDMITKLEGLAMGADGTMADYCDILRTHEPTGPLAVEVVRSDSGETLGGTLNQTPLEVISRPEPQPSDDGGGGAAYTDYEEATDDSGTISVFVPVEWSGRVGLPWTIDGQEVGVSLAASTDVQAWYDTWDVPGLFFGASASLTSQYDVGGLLDANSFADSCEYLGRSDYADPFYTGQYDEYANCGGTGTAFVTIAAEPEDKSFLMFLQVQLVSDADKEALTNILDTFQVVGELP